MIIDLTDLLIGKVDYLDIDEDVIIDDSYFANTSIRDLIGTHFYGNVIRIEDGYQLKGSISGVMVLPDDVTLMDVDYSYDIVVSENFNDGDEFFKIVQNRLDITEFLWQNILVEVPSKIKGEDSDNLTLEGDGWRLITEEELEKGNNSPFSELNDVFNSRKE